MSQRDINLLIVAAGLAALAYMLRGGTVVNPPNPPVITADVPSVLIVENSDDRHQMPSSQVNILIDLGLRDYIKGKGGEFRVVEEGQSPSGEFFKKAMALPRTSLPWIVIGSPGKGYSGPLPETVEETMALIREYAE